LVHYCGWAGAFGGLSIFALIGIALLMTIKLKDDAPQDTGSRGEKAAAMSARV
jgi:hypothetical protein